MTNNKHVEILQSYIKIATNYLAYWKKVTWLCQFTWSCILIAVALIGGGESHMFRENLGLSSLPGREWLVGGISGDAIKGE